MTDKDLTHGIIGAAIEVHRLLGPGLLESAYEECLARELTLRELQFERQKQIPVVYKDVKLECGYRVDLLVGGRIVVELKAVEALAPIHEAIILTSAAFGMFTGTLDQFQRACVEGRHSSIHSLIVTRTR